MFSTRAVVGCAVMAFSVATLIACDKPEIQAPLDVVVSTAGNNFTPTLTYISVGRSIRFDFAGNPDGHSVVFQSRPGAPENVPVTVQGSVYRKFDSKGTFPYSCSVHPDMTGEIVVR